MLVAGAGWVSCLLFFFCVVVFFFSFVCLFFFVVFSSRISYLSFSNTSSLGRRQDTTEILWSRP